MVLDGELSAALEEAVEQERATPKGQNAVDGNPGDEQSRDNDDGDDERNERRRLRRRYRFRLKAAKLGRSRGGLTSKVHLAADGRCRPLSFVLTAGQAGDSPQFRPVLERIKIRLPIGRARWPRTRRTPAAATAPTCVDAGSRRLSGEGRPGGQPQEARICRRPAGHPCSRSLQAAQHGRTLHQPDQTMAWAGFPVRQDTRQLSGRPVPRRGRPMDPKPPASLEIRTPYML
ncbi:hypothetical protein HD595_006555 [Nonomuraea roseoviolacea subsp. carminata]|uniref:Transposase n=1 Tax=Nonomuraea roseoviolacea subsp. carminata TaxID=160689 RepID=A0ABT1K8U6_9ACTN|nr:hypothetical protein [Nonomuraea roseoviolacea subsp. carminata]